MKMCIKNYFNINNFILYADLRYLLFPPNYFTINSNKYKPHNIDLIT